MKIYLSSYWKRSCWFSTIMIVLILLFTVLFCIWSHDDEDYILIVGAVLFVLLFCYLTGISMRLVRYVRKENQQLVMYSLCGRKLSSLSLETDIYYEILPLIEGTCSKRDFIILSNEPFMSYQTNRFSGLAKICKSIDTTGNQVIMPYGTPILSNLNISAWHKID